MNGVSPPRAQQAIAYLVSRGVAPEAAAARVASVSRQRVWQWIRNAEGGCRKCGRPAGPGKVHCYGCQVKENRRQRDKREAGR